MKLTVEQIEVLENFIRLYQIEQGKGIPMGEGYLINAAAVIWEGQQLDLSTTMTYTMMMKGCDL